MLSNSQYPSLSIDLNVIGRNDFDVRSANGTGVSVQVGSTLQTIFQNEVFWNGVGIDDDRADGGLIEQNTIAFNDGDGVRLGDLVDGVQLDANIIAENGGAGVFVEDSAGQGNQIYGTLFGANGGLPIDLEKPGSPGFTANDINDGDTGPNRLLNYPVLGIPVPNGTNGVDVPIGVDVDAPGNYLIAFYRYNQAGQQVHPSPEYTWR